MKRNNPIKRIFAIFVGILLLSMGSFHLMADGGRQQSSVRSSSSSSSSSAQRPTGRGTVRSQRPTSRPTSVRQGSSRRGSNRNHNYVPSGRRPSSVYTHRSNSRPNRPHHNYFDYHWYRNYGHYTTLAHWPMGYCYGPFWNYMYWFYPYYNRFYSQWDYRNSGAVDLNVKPKRAKVFLNGQEIGRVRKYDGFPDYLWLREGSHEVIFYLDGYETVRKVYEIQNGVIIRERFTLNHGDAVEVPSLSNPPLPLRKPEVTREVHPEQDHPQAKRRYYPREKPESDGDLDLRKTPGRLVLNVIPGDATIYLDGKFLGAAQDVINRDGEMLLDVGSHVIEVIRPGYQRKKVEFTLKEGERKTLDLALEKE